MTLTLAIVRCPDSSAPETRTVQGGELSIGRAHDNDWVLPDGGGQLSRKHCVVAFRAGQWRIADLSANGTFVNREADAIGRDAPRALRDGDRLRLGEYEIDVSIAELPIANGAEPARGGGGPAARGYSPSDLDPFGADPMGGPAQTTGFGGDSLLDSPRAGDGAHGSVLLPMDFDPLAPEPESDGFGGGPTQSDHAPSIEQAFRPPPVTAAALPDDWDDLDIAAPAPAVAANPVASIPVIQAPAPVTHAPPIAAPPAPAVARDDLLAAFLRGAGMSDARPADPVAAMAALGAALREMVSGLRQALIARAGIKGEFRIEQTMVRARGNNPIKFSSDDDDALSALLGVGRRTDMAPAEAVADALRDMRLHELATTAAMRSAIGSLLAALDPAAIARGVEGGLAVLPAQKKARAWEAFEALHAKTTRAMSDDFDSVFGKSFARAYEQALKEASSREGPR